jgi:Protein of unknown function (DUF998)
VPGDRSARRWAAGGVAGPAAFVVGWSVLGATKAGYSPVEDTISRLAAVGAPGTRTAMTGALVAYGLGLLADAAAVRAVVPGRAWLAAAGSGLAALGVAATPLDTSAAVDVLHKTVAGLGYATLAAVPALSVLPLRRGGRRGWATSATIAAGVTASSLLASVADVHPGLFQRLGLTVADLWIMALAAATLGGIPPVTSGTRRVR